MYKRASAITRRTNRYDGAAAPRSVDVFFRHDIAMDENRRGTRRRRQRVRRARTRRDPATRVGRPKCQVRTVFFFFFSTLAIDRPAGGFDDRTRFLPLRIAITTHRDGSVFLILSTSRCHLRVRARSREHFRSGSSSGRYHHGRTSVQRVPYEQYAGSSKIMSLIKTLF